MLEGFFVGFLDGSIEDEFADGDFFCKVLQVFVGLIANVFKCIPAGKPAPHVLQRHAEGAIIKQNERRGLLDDLSELKGRPSEAEQRDEDGGQPKCKQRATARRSRRISPNCEGRQSYRQDGGRPPWP